MVVTFEVYARYPPPVPVLCDGVKFLEGVTQNFDMSFTNILDAKIIEN